MLVVEALLRSEVASLRLLFSVLGESLKTLTELETNDPIKYKALKASSLCGSLSGFIMSIIAGVFEASQYKNKKYI